MASDLMTWQLIAMDDQSLIRYIFNSWGPHQTPDMEDIVDWDIAPIPRQIALVQRFIAVRPLAKGTQPLDFNELVAKLEVVSRAELEQPLWGEDLWSSHLAQPTCGPTASGLRGGGKMYQTLCYHALVEEGGRPPCLLSLLDDVYQQPWQYVELMKPWFGNPAFLTGSADELGVFSRPLQRWRQFRRWQADNRGVALPEDDQGLAAFREAHGRHLKSLGLEHVSQAPGYDGEVEVLWRRRRNYRRWEREKCREVGTFANGGFGDYFEAARRRLQAHGFTDHFQLLQNAAQQDSLATWVEYVEFECWWLDWREEELERHKVQRNVTWVELQRAGVLGEAEIDVIEFVEAARRRRRQRKLVHAPWPGGRPDEWEKWQREVEGDAGCSSCKSKVRLRENLTDRLCRESEAGHSAEAFRASQVLLLAWAWSQTAEMMKEARKRRGGASLCHDELEVDGDEERMAKRHCMRDRYVHYRTKEELERWRRENEEKIMVARHSALLQAHIITAELERQE